MQLCAACCLSFGSPCNYLLENRQGNSVKIQCCQNYFFKDDSTYNTTPSFSHGMYELKLFLPVFSMNRIIY